MLTALVIIVAIFGAQIAWLAAQDWWDARHVIAETQAEDMEAIVAATKEPPAAGNAAAPVPRPAAPQQPAPPPGPRLLPPAHTHGGIAYTSRRYRCGCTHCYSPLGVLFHVVACRPGADVDWDAEFRRITP